MRNLEEQGPDQHHRTGKLTITSLASLWRASLRLRPRWIATIGLIPLLYALGWLLVQPLRLALPFDTGERLALFGTLASLVLLFCVLPSWVRERWNSTHPWISLGLRSRRDHIPGWQALLGGLGRAAILIFILLLPLLIGSWGRWLGELSLGELFNALVLCFGVGLAEELLFRGWLWGELKLFFDSRTAVLLQALIFSLVHTRFNLGFLPMVSLLTGLLLLGIVLAMQRRLDEGSLWGCIGLHGGLVGGWFALRAGLLQFSPDAPTWLVGPGGIHANPLGGIIGIGTLMVLLWRQLTALANAARPCTGA